MPTVAADKVVVTNFARLKEKYGASGVTTIRQAVKNLIDADDKRGLRTVLVDLSSSTEMKKYRTPAVPLAKAQDPKSNKRSIDGVYKYFKPAYLMLLGSIDVIPHQDLKNPLYSPEDDTDEFAYSDLPYACEAAYSQSIRAFVTPTRVVGRLPDITGGTDPAYLANLLQIAAGYQDRPVAAYDFFLGLSAEVWRESTQSSLQAVFGTSAGMKISPPDGPDGIESKLQVLAHFINCHGAPADWRFYGQQGSNFPTAHDATKVRGRLREGTVLAAECCYGAELYDPALARGNLGMCNTYLEGKAYAFFGSSTIAYGPASGNDQADLICQYFLQRIRAGSSAGRACLEARLHYLQQARVLKPTDLKTIAQFNLMGDPALTPVESAEPPPHLLATSSKAKGMPAAIEKAARFLRRATLHEIARAAASTVYTIAEKAMASGGAKKAVSSLLAEAAKLGIEDPFLRSFAVQKLGSSAATALGKSIAVAVPTRVHSLLKRATVPAEAAKVVHIHGVEAIEYDGTMEMRQFFSR
jgi:hypothetical protein